MAIDKRLSFLREKFDNFYSILDATTIPVNDGRRVDGIAHAVALSEATEELYAGIHAAYEYLTQQHGISTPKYPPGFKIQGTDSPDGPWEDIPPEQVKITCIPIRGVALLMAALNSASKVVAHSPDSKGNRWHWGDIISTDDLAQLDSVNKLLAMPAATGGGARQVAGDADKPVHKRSTEKGEVRVKLTTVLNLEPVGNNELARSAGTGGGAGQDRADDERPKPAKSSKAVPAKERRIKWLAEAMMLRRENPAMSKAEIARRVGINPGQLSPSRCPEFHELEKMIQGEVPGGHLTSNPESRQSDVEAYTADRKSDRGLPISGSKHFREYCAKCDDPIRVTEDKIGTKPRGKDCA